MSEDTTDSGRDALLSAVGRLGPALLTMMTALERVARHLHPPEIPALRRGLEPIAARLHEEATRFAETSVPAELSDFAEQLRAATERADRAGRLFLGRDAEGGDGIAAVLGAMREHCRAQALLFPLRSVLPPLDVWFVEPDFESRLPDLARGARSGAEVGLFGAGNAADARGGFSLYVPEDYDDARDWPLVVALHGGFGHGADFIWTWLREARSRGWILLAPTSRGTTWSLMGPDVDAASLDSMLAYVRERWRVDAGRMLLTGLSDGATYTLLHGLREGSPFTALAPVSGVLHPHNFANGNVARAAGRRIRLVHGALDWMFPVDLARQAAKTLRDAGAAIEYDEAEDLSHAYPRERNGAILEWAGESPARG